MYVLIPRVGCFSLLVTLLFCPLPALADSDVSVVTANGRSFVGDIDERTDDQTLWIRRTEENIVLTSAVAWTDVESATLKAKSIDVAELFSLREKLSSSGPRTFLTEFEIPGGESTLREDLPGSRPARVVSIAIDAGLANFDRTVESDGLLLVVSAVDSTGSYVPVRGALSARLIVERLDQHTGEVSFEDFGRWSKSVSTGDFYEGAAEVPLRFRRLSPEFDWQLCTAALLNVRLSVHGEGNFEASVPVAIQQFNPIRDEIRNQQGARFYRNELSHRTRQGGTRNLHRGYSTP